MKKQVYHRVLKELQSNLKSEIREFKMSKQSKTILSNILSGFIGLFFIFVILVIFTQKTVSKYINVNRVLLISIGVIALAAVVYALIVLAKLFSKHCSKLFENTRAALSIIIVLTALPRLIWINIVSVVPKSDFDTYNRIASELVKGGVAGDGNYISIFPHVIGYPAFLSIFYRLFGSHVIVAQIVNVFLCIGIAILIFYIGKRISDIKCGFFAAVIWAFWPSQIEAVSLVATEELYTFLCLTSILLFLYAAEIKNNYKKTAALFCVLGFLCSLVNAVRPFGLILVIAAGIYLFIFADSESRLKKRLLIKTGFYLIMVLIYLISNLTLNFIISKTINKQIAAVPAGYSIYVGSNPVYGGMWNAEDSTELGLLMEDKNITPQQVHNILQAMGIERFKNPSIEIFSLLKNKIVNLWGSDNDAVYNIRDGLDNKSIININKYFSVFNVINIFYYYLFIIFCIYSCVAFIKKKSDFKLVFLLLVLIGIILIHLIVEVSPRYHYLAISILAIIPAYGIALKTKINDKEVIISDSEKMSELILK